MQSIGAAGIVFACAFGGALLGIFLRGRLPADHLAQESQAVVKLATGLVGSMAALVLGLMVSSATSDFNSQKAGYQQLATNLVLLDRALAHYGPDTAEARESLRRAVSLAADRIWPIEGTRGGKLDSSELTASGDALYVAIRDLKPTTEAQRSIQSQALAIGGELGRIRWQLSQQDDSSIPNTFLVVLSFWLAVLFCSFGLFSAPNATIVIALFVCALSVAGAIFLIVDLDQPFEGLIRISSTPMRAALSQLGR